MNDMSWKVWKKDEEKAEEEFKKAYEKGVHLKNWKKAIEHFNNAAELYRKCKTPELEEKAKIAIALSWLFKCVVELSSTNLMTCASAMQSLGDTILKIPYEASSAELATELQLLGSESALEESIPSSVENLTPEQLVNIAKKYEQLATQYIMVQRDFVIGKLFNTTINGFRTGQRLLGMSRIYLGKAIEKTDPTKALEHYNEALGYFKSISYKDYEELQRKIRKLGIVAKCWFCGREVQGADINFVFLPVGEVTPYLKNKYAETKPISMSGDMIVACKVCYNSIYGLADSIAKAYYEQVMENMKTAIAILEQRIEYLEQVVRSLTLLR